MVKRGVSPVAALLLPGQGQGDLVGQIVESALGRRGTDQHGGGGVAIFRGRSLGVQFGLQLLQRPPALPPHVSSAPARRPLVPPARDRPRFARP